MRSRLIKKSLLGLSGLPRTSNQHLTSMSKLSNRSGFSPWVQFTILFASLGLSLVILSGLHLFRYSRSSTAANPVLLQFTSKPPVVDRAILEKIAGLDLEDETNSESGTELYIPINIHSYVSSPFFRPPRVTRIPEVQPQAPPKRGIETKNRVCSERNANDTSSSCKFLLPLTIAERGLDSRFHLAQLSELARTLNRTLVLPNVGKNGMGTCRRWRFSVYYDEEAMLNGGDSSDFIQQDRFKAWVESLVTSPSSQFVSVDWTYSRSFPPLSMDGQSNGGLDFYTNNSNTATSLRSFTGCLNRKFPRLDLTGPFPPLSFVVTGHSEQERNDRDMSWTLLENLSRSAITHVQPEPLGTIGDHSASYEFDRAQVSPDVLIVSWNTPLPIFQPYPAMIIHHSPQLRALAARLTRRLGSYIAVIWDVETSNGDTILGCVEALRSVLHYVLSSQEQLGIGNIWLAGNLSPSVLLHSSEPLYSSTFTKGSFFASGVKITGIRHELERMVREGEEVDDVANNGDEVVRKQAALKDSGVLEILDKLVSMRSTVFVTASKGCGKTRCVLPSPLVNFH